MGGISICARVATQRHRVTHLHAEYAGGLGSLPCTAPSMAHLGGVEPKFGIWEDLPVRWAPGEAWAFIDGDWKQVDSSDVGFNGREIDEESFATLFGVLKTLPAIAFQAHPDR